MDELENSGDGPDPRIEYESKLTRLNCRHDLPYEGKYVPGTVARCPRCHTRFVLRSGATSRSGLPRWSYWGWADDAGEALRRWSQRRAERREVRKRSV